RSGRRARPGARAVGASQPLKTKNVGCRILPSQSDSVRPAAAGAGVGVDVQANRRTLAGGSVAGIDADARTNGGGRSRHVAVDNRGVESAVRAPGGQEDAVAIRVLGDVAVQLYGQARIIGHRKMLIDARGYARLPIDVAVRVHSIVAHRPAGSHFAESS